MIPMTLELVNQKAARRSNRRDRFHGAQVHGAQVHGAQVQTAPQLRSFTVPAGATAANRIGVQPGAGLSPSVPLDHQHLDELKDEFLQLVLQRRDIERRLAAAAYRIDTIGNPNINPQDVKARKAADKRTTEELAFLAKISLPEAQQWLKNGRLIAHRDQFIKATQAGQKPAPEVLADQGLMQLADALENGELSGNQATIIEDALRRPDLKLGPEAQSELATELIRESEETGVSLLRRKANHKATKRGTSTPLEQEKAVQSRRFIHIGALQDGMHRLTGSLTPEAAATFKTIMVQANNPARFEKMTEQMTATGRQEFLERLPGAHAHDAIMDFLKAGMEGDPDRVPFRDVSVTIMVDADQLQKSDGIAWLEETGEMIPVQTAERVMCDAGTEIAKVSTDGQVLDLGRAQRLFNRAQKRALAVRDGGCRWPDCDRPISMTEAHHIKPWQAGGTTNLDNGILLCRKHHLELHNTGHQIITVEDPGQKLTQNQNGGSPPMLHRLQPPPGYPNDGQLIPMPTKAPWRSEKPGSV